MSRTNLAHRAPLEDAPSSTPRILTKTEFGRRLKALAIERGWSQSQLAREASRHLPADKPLGRDSVSTYIAGRTWPTPRSLKALADAFSMKPEELLPNAALDAMEDAPSMEMREAQGQPGRVWLKINRLMTFGTAAKIVDAINQDELALS